MNAGILIALAVGAWVLSRAAGGAIAAPTGARGEPSLYTVKIGESVSSIARDELDDVNRWRELAKLNDLLAPYVIRTGQQLLMPGDY